MVSANVILEVETLTHAARRSNRLDKTNATMADIIGSIGTIAISCFIIMPSFHLIQSEQGAIRFLAKYLLEALLP